MSRTSHLFLALALAAGAVGVAGAASATPGADGTLLISSDSVLDTLTGQLNGGATYGQLVAESPSGTHRLFEFTDLTVAAGATLRFTGPYAAEVHATGAITVDGTVDAGAHSSSPGPGGGTGGAAAAAGHGGLGGQGISGGGGGGFLSGSTSSNGTAGQSGDGYLGGMGGLAGPGCGGGAGNSGLGTHAAGGGCGYGGGEARGGGGGGGGGVRLADGRLRGGSGGGSGASGVGSPGGAGGGGGGALSLESDASISVGGVVVASGVGGSNAVGSGIGAGGAGGGGVVVLRAPTVSVPGLVTAGGTPAPGGMATYEYGGSGAQGAVYVEADCFADSSHLGGATSVAGYSQASTGRAVDDAYSLAVDTSLNVAAPGVLGNDCEATDPAVSSAAQHGTVTLSSDGSFTYVPDAGYTGPDGFDYTATVPGGMETATVSLDVTATNRAPVAAPEDYTTPHDTALVVNDPGVLGNDSDPDGGALTAGVATGPTHGTLLLSVNGGFTYTPDPGYSGPDSFVYAASDGWTSSPDTTVTLTVTPPAPAYAATVRQPINADGSSTFKSKREVVPVKFVLTADGAATCDLPAATIRVSRVSGGLTSAVDESVFTGAADAGTSFRVSDCQYVYNLAASGLGMGRYRVDILIGDVVVGSADFEVS
jgi:hypothetical protein